MSSGTYFPHPEKLVEKPKKSGGKRALGVPLVGDREAQMIVKMYIEPKIDPIFHNDSYGYRPGKSAIDAVGLTDLLKLNRAYLMSFSQCPSLRDVQMEMLTGIRGIREKTLDPVRDRMFGYNVTVNILYDRGERPHAESG